MGCEYRYLISIILGVAVTVVWWSCANPTSPEGGPKDLSPPEIIGVYPEPNATNVRTDVIRFRFNKYIDRNTFQQALFMSPVISGIEYVWKGRDVELRIGDSLRTNTTYSLTVGTDVRDTRERTRMSQSFTLAFSTGPVIDIGQISGKVYDKDPAGIYVFSYTLGDSASADTLDPAFTEPDYITQTGDDGEFILPYLAFGTYRILAIRDQFRNRLYDKLNDAVGVYRNDITLTEGVPAYDGVTLRVHKPDHTEPFLSRVSADHMNRITVRFSKAIDPATVDVSSFSVVDSVRGQHLDIKSVSVRKQVTSEVFLYSADQDSVEYTLTVAENVMDMFGNTIRPDSRMTVFTGSAEPLQGQISIDYIYPSNRTQGVRPDETISLQFSSPVLSENPERFIWVVDTNDVVVKGKYWWSDETSVLIRPDDLLESLMTYYIKVTMDSLPHNGFGYEDSVFVSRFTTLDRGLLGGIEGSIFSDDESFFTIVAEQAVSSREPELHTVTVPGPGSYLLERIPQGIYQIWGFRDEEKKGIYDYGSVYPFIGSASFGVYPDTVRVRARWNVDGINLDLRIRDSAGRPEEEDEPETEDQGDSSSTGG
jgi:hypothetical protein